MEDLLFKEMTIKYRDFRGTSYSFNPLCPLSLTKRKRANVDIEIMFLSVA